MTYSSQKISPSLVEEIRDALQNISYGSVEIYVQDKKVTQITVRNIKKTSVTIGNELHYKKNGVLMKPEAQDDKIRVLTIKK